MGGQVSSRSKISENEAIRRFTGLEPITDNDPFWNQLLSFNFKVDTDVNESGDAGEASTLVQFEMTCMEMLEALMYNTSTTGNFAALTRVFLRRAAELKTSQQCEDKIFLWQTGNALIVFRYCCKFFTQRLSEKEFTRMFAKNVLKSDGQLEVLSDFEEPFENAAEEFINALVEIVVDLPVNAITEGVHSEAVRCLLAVLSSQLYRDTPHSQGSSLFLKYLTVGRCAIHAPLLTKSLLRNLLLYSDAHGKPVIDLSGSMVLGIAASMWKFVEWSVGAENDNGQIDYNTAESQTLGSLSLLLLLDLACFGRQSGETATRNPYRDTLASFTNSQEVSALANPTQSVATFKLDYSALYERLCTSASRPAVLLLLYLLLHRNIGFRNYLLSRVNMENLVLPVIRVLHSGTSAVIVDGDSSHHIYLALICVLIFSEDDFFCKVVHETTLKNIDWFNSDRPITEITLGGLIILVLVRTIQSNTVKTRDRYLHTNCLAALANMSAFFKQLSAGVCQKLIGLLELLTRRHAKLLEHIRRNAEYDLGHTVHDDAQETTEQPATAAVTNQQQDMTALEEGIRTLLEIINSCLTSSLRHNPHLIYTMLYKRQLFDSFHNHPMFQDLIWNISAVLNHFSARVAALDKGASVSSVLDVIQKGALQWPTDRLKKFPDLKFKYVEDENTADFFVPYVWRLICRYSGLSWGDPTRIKLFNAQFLLSSQKTVTM